MKHINKQFHGLKIDDLVIIDYTSIAENASTSLYHNKMAKITSISGHSSYPLCHLLILSDLPPDYKKNVSTHPKFLKYVL